MVIQDAIDWTSVIDPKLPIATQAYTWIKRAILTLELKPDEALSEKELSVKFGISRTPVREALIKLADEGLVDIFPQRGTYVSPIRVSQVLEAQFIREALEVAVVRKAAEKMNAAAKQQLHANLEEQSVAVQDANLQAFIRLDEAFHHTFSALAEMPRAWRVIQNVKGQLDRVRFLSLPHPGHLAQLYDQHTAIAEAAIKGDAEQAAQHMRHHLREVFKSVDELISEKPELFE